MTGICRRSLMLAPLGYVAACTTTRWYRPEAARDGVLRVPLSEIGPEGYVQVEAGQTPFVLQRDATGGLVAITLVCTHQGCAVSRRRDELICPCHGSRFDLEGKVLDGPATRPLPRWPVEVVGDVALIRTGES